MVDLSGIDRAPSLVDRAKAMILTPREEWPKIALESTPQGDILRGYVLPLAAISPAKRLAATKPTWSLVCPPSQANGESMSMTPGG